MFTDPVGFYRRFANISVSGVTEPKVVPALEGNPGIVQENRNRQQQRRSRARQREHMLTMSEIESVEFNLFSTEEIDSYAVVNVTSSAKEGPGTVRDLKMGPHSESMACDTCSNDIRGCPGHYGKIILPKLMHPLAVNHIILVLSCVCNTCGRLLVTKEEIERAGISRMSGLKRLQNIKELVSKNKRSCERYTDMKGVQKCDPNPIFSSIKENKDDYRLSYTYPGAQNQKKTPFFLLPEIPDNMPGKSIYKILHSIPREDCDLLGFDVSHPKDMIMERLVVIPYCARPDLYQGDSYYPDDLTTMYIDIIKSVNAYNNLNNNEADRDMHIKSINFKVSHLMKNDGRYNQGGVKVYTDVKKRVQGKTAIVRANLMGKRVNYAGRTVAGPGHDLRVDEAGIPRLMAQDLTRPIRVAEFNRTELQSRYDDGLVKHITMISGSLAGTRVMVSDRFKVKFPNYTLQLGDIVERVLEDGDIVLINRQPTLHKQSILLAYARIKDQRIVTINLSITTPLNADFDGDELNVHVPQTIEAYAEAEQLLGIYRNLMSSQNNKPMMGIVYDSLSGAYLMTHPQTEMDKINEELSQTHDPLKIQDLESRRALLKPKCFIDPVVYKMAIQNVINAPQYATLSERLSQYNVPEMSGRALISAAFPENFDYRANGVVIKNGILVKGTLTSASLGNKDGSIIGEMVKQMGGLITVDFMSDIQFIVRDYLMNHGLSVSAHDCSPQDNTFRDAIDTIVTETTLKILSYSGETSHNKIMAEQQERKIQDALEAAKDQSGNIVHKYFDEDNAIKIMADSGAKGTIFNAVQMSSILGQQKVNGRRIPTNLPGGRSLPCIEPGDKDPRARGFVKNSFCSGLEPCEFFFHIQGGREGLTDTAVNTSQTGFLQHQIIKSAEDIHISPDGSVRSADNAIVQFIYGDDGYDSSELSTIQILNEKMPFFRNLYQLAEKVNRRYT